MINPAASFFQGKPYTRPLIVFHDFSGTVGEQVELWLPKNAYFELAAVICKATVAIDLNLCDTNPHAIIGFIGMDGVNYSVFQPGALAGIRSNSYTQAALLAVDPVGVASSAKFAIYGWEVTPQSGYRTGS